MISQYQQRLQEYADVRQPLIDADLVDHKIYGYYVDRGRKGKIGAYSRKMNVLKSNIERLTSENLKIRITHDVSTEGIKTLDVPPKS